MGFKRARRSLATAFMVGLSYWLVACSTPPTPADSSSPPSWITQAPATAGMVYGVGSIEIYGDIANAIKRATELARADLVAQLRVTVSSDFSSATTLASGGGQESSVQKSISHYVRSQIPRVELKEAHVADTWTDKNTVYVLVEVDRAKEAANLRLDLMALDDDLETLNQRPTSGSTLQQLQPLLPALTQFAQRQQLVERLDFISLQRTDTQASASIKTLRTRIEQLLDALVVSLELQDAGAQELQASLLEGLTQQGLRVQQKIGADLYFVVRASLSQQRQGANHYAFAQAQVQIEDADRRVLSAFSQQAKGVSGIAEVARQKAGENLAQALAKELATTLVDKIR